MGFLNYVKHAHAHLGHEPDAWRLAHLMRLDVIPGHENALLGRTITLRSEDRYSNRAPIVLRHEIAHYLLQLSGAESEIHRLQGSHEAGLPTVEMLCYHAALILQIPGPVLVTAQAELGNTPQAIVRIAALSGAPVVDSLHRWVYAEVGAKRAAWVARGELITHAASANCWLPFWRYAEVPDVLGEVPNALLHPLGERETLGVVSW